MGTDSYLALTRELQAASDQAVLGKGAERHACGEDFQDQVILETTRRVGLGFPLGQAVKKIYESQRLMPKAAIHELRGAIIYLVAAAIYVGEGAEREAKSGTEILRVDTETAETPSRSRDKV